MLSPQASPPLSTSPLAVPLVEVSMMRSLAVHARVFTSPSVSLCLVVSGIIKLIVFQPPVMITWTHRVTPPLVLLVPTLWVRRIARTSSCHNADVNTPGALDRNKVKADFSNFGRPLDGAFPVANKPLSFLISSQYGSLVSTFSLPVSHLGPRPRPSPVPRWLLRMSSCR